MQKTIATPYSTPQFIIFAVISLFAGLCIAVSVSTRGAAATPRAAEACSASRDKSSCEKGYNGKLANKTQKDSCRGLSGSKKNVCESGWDKAKQAVAAGHAVTTQAGNVQQSPLDLGSLPDADAKKSTLDTLANVAFGIAGSLSLLFVVIGGVRYVMSSGDPNNLSRAKNTILYAIIGLVVTISAFAIVRFVLMRVV